MNTKKEIWDKHFKGSIEFTEEIMNSMDEYAEIVFKESRIVDFFSYMYETYFDYLHKDAEQSKTF